MVPYLCNRGRYNLLLDLGEKIAVCTSRSTGRPERLASLPVVKPAFVASCCVWGSVSSIQCTCWRCRLQIKNKTKKISNLDEGQELNSGNIRPNWLRSDLCCIRERHRNMVRHLAAQYRIGLFRQGRPEFGIQRYHKHVFTVTQARSRLERMPFTGRWVHESQEQFETKYAHMW